MDYARSYFSVFHILMKRQGQETKSQSILWHAVGFICFIRPLTDYLDKYGFVRYLSLFNKLFMTGPCPLCEAPLFFF